MNHSTAEIRAALFNRKLKEVPVEWVIDGLEDFTGELSVIELGAKTIRATEKAAEEPDGLTNETLMMAGIVAKGLINRANKERIFADTEIESISEMGVSVLKPISLLISEASGIKDGALDAAKKNYWKILESASATSSQPSSAPTETSTPSSTENQSAT